MFRMRRLNRSFSIPFLIVLLAWANLPSHASGTYFRVDAHALGQHTTLEKGQYRAGLRADFQEYSKVRLSNGLYQDVRDVRLRSYTLFGEYGLSEDSLLYAALPFVDNDAAIKLLQFKATSGLGDMRIGYSRVFPLRGATSILATGEVSFPPVSYDTTRMTAPGDNSLDFTFLASYRNAALFNSPFFFSLGGGVKLRASDSPDQWLWNAEVGRPIGKSASAGVFIDGIASMDGEYLGSPTFQGDFALLKQTVTRVGARVNFAAKGLDGQLYFARSIQWQNQAPSNFFGLVVSRRF